MARVSQSLKSNSVKVRSKKSSSCMNCMLKDSDEMIQCESCDWWLHYDCANLSKNLVDEIDRYYCEACRESDANLKIVWHVKLAKDTSYFTVERILKHRTVGEERQFLIKWLNYPVSANTWEPEKNLDGAINMLQAYLEENKLPYSHVPGRMGSNAEIKRLFNEDNWVTMTQVLNQFEYCINSYFPKKKLHFQEYIDSFGQTGIYFLRYVSHCYTILWQADKQVAMIADGTNQYQTNQDVAGYINGLLKVKCIGVEWLYEAANDHCASAAISIALEFARDLFSQHFRKTLSASSRLRKRTIETLHKYMSTRKVFTIKQNRMRCECGKSFIVRKRYLCHRVLCKVAKQAANNVQ